MRRLSRIGAVIAAVAPVLLAAAGATAQTYPTRPIKFVSSFPPGGGVDATARTIAPFLQQRLGQPVIVENKAGAGGTIGTDYVTKAPKDGYTILVGAPGGISTAPALYKSLPYDPVRDLAPITMGVRMSNLLVVHPSLGVNSVAELLTKAKAEPGKIGFGSGGVGTTLHLSGELLKALANVDLLHVPYKGSGPVLADLLSGQLLMGFTDAAAIEHWKGGRLKVLAQTGSVRQPQMSEIPTIAESGVPGYSAINWFAFFAPAGTPEPILARLNTEIVAILNSPEARARLEGMGMEPFPMTRKDLGDFIAADTKLWGGVVAKAGLKPE